MQLPFTVVIEPLDLAQLRRAARAWWAWASAVGIIASSVGGIAVVRLEAEHHTETVSAALQVSGAPAGATVEVDDQMRGLTPLSATIASGEHRVNLRRDGYAEATYVVRARPGESVMVDADLWLRSPLVARLRPTYPGASIADVGFLSDGRVALTVALPPGDEHQLWLVDGPGRVRRFGPPDAPGRLAVSSDGKRVAYLAPGQGSSVADGRLSEVWVSSRDGERGERRYVLPADARDERLLDLSWAPDGQRLLLASRKQALGGAYRTRLLLFDATTGGVGELASLPSEVMADSYDWSPNGEWVAFLTRAGQITSLCLVGTDGNFRYLTDLGQEDSDPLPIPPLAWSADGRQVLYAAPTQDQTAAGGWLPGSRPASVLFTSELAQPISQRVGSAEGQSPAWRSDGSIVALARPADSGSLTLRLVDPGSETRDLAELPIKAGSAFVARWDIAHAQAIVAVRGSANLGMSQPEYWLVRFRPEAN